MDVRRPGRVRYWGGRDVIHKRSGVYVYVGAYFSLTNNNHPPRSRCLLVGKRVMALACQLAEMACSKIQNETQNRPPGTDR